MPETRAQSRETQLESSRMIAFSDGVVAIAATLLILPLVDINLPDSSPEAQQNPLGYVWAENSSLITGFVISWSVIMVFWFVHHRIFANVKAITSSIIMLNTIWLFAVVVLPFPTNLLSQVSESDSNAYRQVVVFYVVTMLSMSILLGLIGRELRLNPSLLVNDSKAGAHDGQMRSRITIVIFSAVLVAALIVPTYALYGLTALFLADPYLKLKKSRDLKKQPVAAESDPSGQ